MINEKRLIENFIDYVKIDSETKNEKEMCDYLSKQLRKLGFEVIVDEAGKKMESNGYNICAKYPGDSNKEAILLSAHVDTVTPGNGIKPIIDGDIIKSDGTTILGGDDKAGVAIIVECMHAIIENNIQSRPIEAVFSIFEEGGLKGAKEFDFSIIKAREGVVIDSGGPIGSIVTEAPAQDLINVDVHGKAAHAGMEPEAGVSAIQIAARALENMTLYRVDAQTTANFGIISGGTATNIITDHVHLTGETRSLVIDKIDKQTASMKAAFEKAAADLGGSVDFKAERVYNPYVIEKDAKIVVELSEAFKANGFTPICVPTGGGSDTNIYFEKGVQCVNISCGMTAVHTNDEYIKKSDIIGCAKSLFTFLTK